MFPPYPSVEYGFKVFINLDTHNKIVGQCKCSYRNNLLTVSISVRQRA